MDRKILHETEERREFKAQVTIIHKLTGQVVERYEKFYDEAEDFAKGIIQGKESELRYRIYKMN